MKTALIIANIWFILMFSWKFLITSNTGTLTPCSASLSMAAFVLLPLIKLYWNYAHSLISLSMGMFSSKQWQRPVVKIETKWLKNLKYLLSGLLQKSSPELLSEESFL